MDGYGEGEGMRGLINTFSRCLFVSCVLGAGRIDIAGVRAREHSLG